MKLKKVEEDPQPTSKIVGPKTTGPQTFIMHRTRDETGVSGTGKVVEGIVFSNGQCAVTWESAFPSVNVHPSFRAFKAAHIDPHPDNGTEIEWLLGGDTPEPDGEE